MIILGIDPGFAIVGYGVLEYQSNRFRVLDYGAITTDASMEMFSRFQSIYNDLTELIEQFRPDFMAIEELFFNSNQKTAINVAQARGVLLLAAMQHDVRIYEYTPLQVKQAVAGYGRAEKKTGAADGQAAFKPAQGTKAGRYGGRAGNCDLPRALLSSAPHPAAGIKVKKYRAKAERGQPHAANLILKFCGFSVDISKYACYN